PTPGVPTTPPTHAPSVTGGSHRDEAATAARPTAAPRQVAVRIVEGADPRSWGFDPPTVTVRVGDTITWTNAGAAPHTVTAADGSFDSGVVPAGGEWSFTPSAPGTYAYLCSLHPSMRGTLIVEPAAGPGSATTSAPSPTPSSAPAATPSPSPAASGPSVASARRHQARIVDGGYDPPVLTVAVGDTVTWTNADGRRHTVTAVDGSFDSGEVLPGGQWSFTPDRPGTFPYFCAFHPEMRGTLVVMPPGEAPPAASQTGTGAAAAAAPAGPAAAVPVRSETTLVGGGSFAAVRGRARFERTEREWKLRVEVEEVPSAVTTLDVLVGGQRVGTLTVAGDGKARLDLGGEAGGPATSVAGQSVEVRTPDGELVASGRFP
ncbi:MAG TPA: cupredoxin domain-containing protein, partial [Chloroflexota bacterium]